MADDKKKKRGRLLTGTFPGLWCWLLTPDTKFSEDGEFKVDLVMSQDEARELCRLASETVNEQVNELRRDPERRNWKVVWPAKPYEGDEEEYWGKYLVAFRQKIRPQFNFTVDVFDAHKKPIAHDSGLRIGNGTKLRVCFNVRAAASPITKDLRVMFHPVAVQIVDLVPWEADYGFEDTEGFSASNGDAARTNQPFRKVEHDGEFSEGSDTSEFAPAGNIPEDDVPF